MARLRDENYYTVSGWMLNVLALKGNELIVFAVIFSFSQDGESEFNGSLAFLQSFANIQSKQTVLTVLDSLVKKKYIIKRNYLSGNVSRVAYKANLDVIEEKKKGLLALAPSNSEAP